MTVDQLQDQSGTVRSFNSKYVGILHKRRHSIKVLDAHQGGKEVGNVLLPMADGVASFCAGGDSLFLMGEGSNPSLWRLPLPSALYAAGPAQSVDHGYLSSHHVQ